MVVDWGGMGGSMPELGGDMACHIAANEGCNNFWEERCVGGAFGSLFRWVRGAGLLARLAMRAMESGWGGRWEMGGVCACWGRAWLAERQGSPKLQA